MSKSFARWIVTLAFSFAFVPRCFAQGTNAPQHQPQQGQQLASVEQLKVEAFNAFKGGQFDRTSELLTKAATISKDPSLAQMSDWMHQFQTQRQGYVAERRKGFDKAIADVHLLLQNQKESFAIDRVKDAYLLADDKEAFRDEKWVDGLIRDTIRMADDYEKGEQWLKAIRLYSDLSAVEPANPEWKDKLKLAMRRVRLLAVYTPDALEVLPGRRIEGARRSRSSAVSDYPADDQARLRGKRELQDRLARPREGRAHGHAG